jgi:hypothetical protein
MRSKAWDDKLGQRECKMGIMSSAVREEESTSLEVQKMVTIQIRGRKNRQGSSLALVDSILTLSFLQELCDLIHNLVSG